MNARTWAANEVGTAMAHQLNEPLTALLLYLHEIKNERELGAGHDAASTALRQMVEMAIRETERACDILERLGASSNAMLDTEAAVARGREAIESWAWNGRMRNGGTVPSTQSHSAHRKLTPRERQVLSLITGGSSNKEGGHLLGISTRTFEVHRAHIMEKLGARNAADLVRMALSENR